LCVGAFLWREKSGRAQHLIYVLRFVGLLAVIWVASFAVWRELPFVRAGAEIVYSAKDDLERDGRLFPAGVPRDSRLVVFGNSKVLTGFVPAQFDAEVGSRVYSANLGKPDEKHFLRDLEMLARTHQLPRRVVLTLPWASDEKPVSVWAQDDRVIGALFPFRKFPRDLALFGAQARAHGGLLRFYEYGRATVERMEQDRGWYFIEGKSHYPGDRLPVDFRLATDQPDYVDDPAFRPQGTEFRALNEFASAHGTQFYIAPSYHRLGELGPPPERADSVAKRLRGFPNFRVAGPNYFLFENRYFSDPVHLNPEGARLYTRRLADVLQAVLFGQGAGKMQSAADERR
jgi:hypothetical protein